MWFAKQNLAHGYTKVYDWAAWSIYKFQNRSNSLNVRNDKTIVASAVKSKAFQINIFHMVGWLIDCFTAHQHKKAISANICC